MEPESTAVDAVTVRSDPTTDLQVRLITIEHRGGDGTTDSITLAPSEARYVLQRLGEELAG